ncbi:MAG: hypothetical protein P1U46_01925 [Patescibacteria group bacterium]|nr:hypothetical protein [Patescibacteria group bacterium]
MFDPSKLDLNLDSEETNLDKKPEKEEEKIETTKEEEEKQIIKKEDEAKNKDILANLKVEKTIDEKEEKIEDIVENPLLEIIDNDIINENESQIVQEEVIKNKEKEKNEEEKIIYDVNITDLQIVLYLLVDKEYDFVTFEPSNENIKLEFRKNKVVIDTKYIKYPTYS